MYYAGLRRHDYGLVARAQDAMTHGYARAFIGAAAVFAVAMVIAAVTIDSGSPESGSELSAGPAPPRAA